MIDFVAAAPTLSWLDFSNGSENLNVATSLEMRRTGHWLLPTLQERATSPERLSNGRICWNVEIVPAALEEIAGRSKPVPTDHPWVHGARMVGTNLGD